MSHGAIITISNGKLFARALAPNLQKKKKIIKNYFIKNKGSLERPLLLLVLVDAE